MIRLILLLFFQASLNGIILAQTDTSSKPLDTLPAIQKGPSIDTSRKTRSTHFIVHAASDTLVQDSTVKAVLNNTWQFAADQYPGRNFIRQAFVLNKFFGFSGLTVTITSNKKLFHGKEILFYGLVTLLLFFAFIKFSFPKYLIDLLRVAFRTTLKQRQIGEQLLQTPLPSLLLNFFFLVAASLYISFVLEHYHVAEEYNFWLLQLYTFLALALIYIIKFLSLKFCGWLFNISPTTDGYIFIVFMINKIIGIYVLPFLVLLAFTSGALYEASFALSYIGVFALLAYRFILAYGLARNQIKVNPFHFFLYLCAFEIVPLILIYKALLLWF